MEDILNVQMPPEPEPQSQSPIVEVEEREEIPHEDIFKSQHTSGKPHPVHDHTSKEIKQNITEVINEQNDVIQPQVTCGQTTPAKKKRVATDKQKAHLAKARAKASERRRLLKEQRQRIQNEVNRKIKEENENDISQTAGSLRQEAQSSINMEEVPKEAPKRVTAIGKDNVVSLTEHISPHHMSNQHISISRKDFDDIIQSGIDKYEIKRKARKSEKNKIKEKEKAKLLEQQQNLLSVQNQAMNQQRVTNNRANMVHQAVMRGATGQQNTGDVWSQYCF